MVSFFRVSITTKLWVVPLLDRGGQALFFFFSVRSEASCPGKAGSASFILYDASHGNGFLELLDLTSSDLP